MRDQLVLVTEPEPSPASRRLAGTLVELGHAVVAVAAAASARLLPGVRGVVPLPPPPAGVVAADPVAAPRRWEEVPPWWRGHAHQLAELLAADWRALGIATADSKPAGQAAQTACRSRR